MISDPGDDYANLPVDSLERHARGDEATKAEDEHGQEAKYVYDNARIAERLSMEVAAWLALSMPDSLVHIVQDIDVGKPYLIWRALLAEFQRDTMSSRLALRRELYNSHLGNKDFSEYVAGIRNVVKRIKSLGDHIDDTAW
jgi:hypothetical protein